MNPLSSIDCDKLVSQPDIETLLAAVVGGTPDPIAGIFGPGSVSWRINRESALFLGAGRAALLQIAHPWVAAAIAEHSTVLDRPIARFHNTFRIVFTMVFGSVDQALAAARHLYSLHTYIHGELPEDVARWPRGSRYQANNVAALRWVFATLVESAVLAHDWILAPLTAVEREQYYDECKILAGLFGLSEASLPGSWEEFCAYNRAMHNSDELGVSDKARVMAHNLLVGAGSRIRPPFWYRALTMEWLPERFRNEFDLKFAGAEKKAVQHVKRWLPAIYQRLPFTIRFIGPWREGQARLAGRRADALTRWNNRFWIGQPLLPFAKCA